MSIVFDASLFKGVNDKIALVRETVGIGRVGGDAESGGGLHLVDIDGLCDAIVPHAAALGFQ